MAYQLQKFDICRLDSLELFERSDALESSGTILQPGLDDRTMTKFLISFPAPAMDVPDEEMAAVGEAARAVIREAKDAGVCVFAGGINEDVAALMVAADGSVSSETYPQTTEFDGSFCVLELSSREVAIQWAAKIASACRCSQELREFGYQAES